MYRKGPTQTENLHLAQIVMAHLLNNTGHCEHIPISILLPVHTDPTLKSLGFMSVPGE